jgi:hypothetical protein
LLAGFDAPVLRHGPVDVYDITLDILHGGPDKRPVLRPGTLSATEVKGSKGQTGSGYDSLGLADVSGDSTGQAEQWTAGRLRSRSAARNCGEVSSFWVDATRYRGQDRSRKLGAEDGAP